MKFFRYATSEEFMDLPPKQIVPALADKGEFIASESTIYRILRAVDQVHHRGRTAKPQFSETTSFVYSKWPQSIVVLGHYLFGQHHKRSVLLFVPIYGHL